MIYRRMWTALHAGRLLAGAECVTQSVLLAVDERNWSLWKNVRKKEKKNPSSNIHEENARKIFKISSKHVRPLYSEAYSPFIKYLRNAITRQPGLLRVSPYYVSVNESRCDCHWFVFYLIFTCSR